MIENIKLIIGIELDNKEYDSLILLWINKVTAVVLEYCKINELTTALEGFIEDKVVAIVKGKVGGTSGGGGVENTGEVKAITRGDTKIEYNVSSSAVVVEKSTNANLTTDEKKFLNYFRKLQVI